MNVEDLFPDLLPRTFGDSSFPMPYPSKKMVHEVFEGFRKKPTPDVPGGEEDLVGLAAEVTGVDSTMSIPDESTAVCTLANIKEGMAKLRQVSFPPPISLGMRRDFGPDIPYVGGPGTSVVSSPFVPQWFSRERLSPELDVSDEFRRDYNRWLDSVFGMVRGVMIVAGTIVVHPANEKPFKTALADAGAFRKLSEDRFYPKYERR